MKNKIPGLTELYQINYQPMIAPDQDVAMSFEDLDAAQSGRDEAGFMHRVVVRSKVGVWEFSYSHLTGEQYRYLLSILPASGSFTFTHPSPADSTVMQETQAYLSKYSVVWHSARTDTYRNLKFSIIAC